MSTTGVHHTRGVYHRCLPQVSTTGVHHTIGVYHRCLPQVSTTEVHRCLPQVSTVHPLKHEQHGCLFRHNEELEQDSVAMQAAARKLQREANSLARRLEAVMHDKLKDRTSFDATTPIDKTLEYLQNAIMVSSQPVRVCACACAMNKLFVSIFSSSDQTHGLVMHRAGLRTYRRRWTCTTC